MTQIVHIANTNVEYEFAQVAPSVLAESMSAHSYFLQLQFLPLLYAEPNDSVAVTHLPCKEYLESLQKSGIQPLGLPSLIPLQEVDRFLGKKCCSWGHSRQVQEWAQARHMQYTIPIDWQMVCLVNSKAFSFRYTTLAEAILLHNEQELLHWVHLHSGPKILKTCFGLAGQGNRQIKDNAISKQILAFAQKEWKQGRPLIGEPLLERVLDFSTQWMIHPSQQIEFIGATRFETDSHGSYLGTLAGPQTVLFNSIAFYLDKHKQAASQALADMARMGFFGFVGIDSLLYRDKTQQSLCLYPVVEINARKTFSLVALLMQKKLCPDQILRLSFRSGDDQKTSLLPRELVNNKGVKISFRRQLTAEFLELDSDSFHNNQNISDL